MANAGGNDYAYQQTDLFQRDFVVLISTNSRFLYADDQDASVFDLTLIGFENALRNENVVDSDHGVRTGSIHIDPVQNPKINDRQVVVKWTTVRPYACAVNILVAWENLGDSLMRNMILRLVPTTGNFHVPEARNADRAVQEATVEGNLQPIGITEGRYWQEYLFQTMAVLPRYWLRFASARLQEPGGPNRVAFHPQLLVYERGHQLTRITVTVAIDATRVHFQVNAMQYRLYPYVAVPTSLHIPLHNPQQEQSDEEGEEEHDED